MESSHPDKKIETKAAPAPYAWAGATYQTSLDNDESLLLTGRIEIDVFVAGGVQIPLRLGGGVLTEAQLDGKPARLSAAAAREPQQVKQSAALATDDPFAPPQPKNPGILVLHLSDKGHHALQLAIRIKLSRQGGWRVAEGVLPSAPAAALTIAVPKPQTELRLAGPSDRRSYETQKPDEEIRTALGSDGDLSIQWRPKVAEGQAEQNLTAASAAVLDVQEDGLRLTWQLALEFRRSQRDRFTLVLPAGYLLEKVEGNNVRGWEIRKRGQGEEVEVSLLQVAKDHEQLKLVLWRAGPVGSSRLAEFDVPLVSLQGAALHNGQLTIRRSPLIELRTLTLRRDPDRSAQGRGGIASRGKRRSEPVGDPALRIVSFSRRAVRDPPGRGAVGPAHRRHGADGAADRRVRGRSLESRITFDVQARPIHQLQMLLPQDLHVDRVSVPGEFQYAVTQQDKRPLLTIYLAQGRQGSLPVIVRGRLGHEGSLKEMAYRIRRLGTVPIFVRRKGDCPPGESGSGCCSAASRAAAAECGGLGRGSAAGRPGRASGSGVRRGCRRPAKLRTRAVEPVVRLAEPAAASSHAFGGMHYARGDYTATLRLAPRKADVACDTITNVRVTDRAIETTILLDFSIRTAGVREISFLLPGDMADSRIHVPMLRQKTVEPLAKDPGGPVRADRAARRRDGPASHPDRKRSAVDARLARRADSNGRGRPHQPSLCRLGRRRPRSAGRSKTTSGAKWTCWADSRRSGRCSKRSWAAR